MISFTGCMEINYAYAFHLLDHIFICPYIDGACESRMYNKNNLSKPVVGIVLQYFVHYIIISEQIQCKQWRKESTPKISTFIYYINQNSKKIILTKHFHCNSTKDLNKPYIAVL